MNIEEKLIRDRERLKLWRKNNPDKYKAQLKRRYEKNKDIQKAQLKIL
jgi:hypothetical protein